MNFKIRSLSYVKLCCVLRKVSSSDIKPAVNSRIHVFDGHAFRNSRISPLEFVPKFVIIGLIFLGSTDRILRDNIDIKTLQDSSVFELEPNRTHCHTTYPQIIFRKISAHTRTWQLPVNKLTICPVSLSLIKLCNSWTSYVISGVIVFVLCAVIVLCVSYRLFQLCIFSFSWFGHDINESNHFFIPFI